MTILFHSDGRLTHLKQILQKAVIDVLDNIKKCIVNDSPAGIVLIDFRKAFDTISHNYILKSLKFFNGSDYMII